MLKSMTGYGRAVSDTGSLEISVEIKTLNSKFLDLNLRLPREYSDKEIEVRNLISSTLERGKISFGIDVQPKLDKPKVSVNRELVKHYYKDLSETASLLGAPHDELLKIALQMPKAMNQDADESDHAEEWEQVLKVIHEAIDKCDNYRRTEGEALGKKLAEYIHQIESGLEKVIQADPQRMENIRARIQSHLDEYGLHEQVDKNRFEQELIYYIEKLDISEEKVRLKSHLDYFLTTMKTENSGKKLGFITQEIGREINTIGSKANDAAIQKYVVEMKEELEKIKEQSLNIL